ncbi:MAG: YitT family protein [Bacteroidota bacterium]|nr:YitT family protein [Bacteroidota bacterium]
MQYQKVFTFIIDKLQKELPSYLTYHSKQHTQDVVNAAQHLVASEKISEEDGLMVLTASLFHDTGFVKGYENHETSSCEIARQILPSYEYDKDQIEKICKLIMATKAPQQPSNLMEEILCDADLYYLGTNNYFVTAEELKTELIEADKFKKDTDWNKVQIDFLKKHRYFTLTAIKENDKKKKENLQHLLIKQELEKTMNKNKHPLFLMLKDLVFIIIGVLIAGFALKGFLSPNHFFDGGVTGISLLLHELYDINLSIIIVIVNLPFVVMSFFTVGKKFALKTFGCIALLSICLLFFPYPVMTSDKLLISIFGGFFIGLGIGLIMRAGCALDGVEILALYTFKKTSFTVTEIILAINIAIFGIAAFKLGIETAMYSVLTYFTATKTIDFVVEGIEAYTGVTIISGKSELIKYRLVNELNRGITVYKGERGFLPGKFETSTDCDIIFTVVTRLELRKLKNVVHEVDTKAFVFANTIKEATGGILRRRQVH